MTRHNHSIYRAWAQLIGGGTLGIGILVSVATLAMDASAARATFNVSFPVALLGVAILGFGNWATRETYTGPRNTNESRQPTAEEG